MNKNAIHNFNISIQNSTAIKSSEDLTQTIITELAKVSREMNQQKDIEQLWLEQKSQNAASLIAEEARVNSIVSSEGGIVDTIKSFGTTPSVYDTTTFSSSVPIGGGAADDSAGRMTMRSATSDNTTPPVMGAEDSSLDFSNATSQLYTNVREQQTLSVPQMFQTSNNEPAIETVKEAIQKKLDVAKQVNDPIAIDYWTKISKAFEEGLVAADFDGKPDHLLFTEMYKVLKQSGQIVATVQNFNWEIIRKKMVESIDANILNGIISEVSKKRWETIRDQLKNDTTNVANLFEQYDELFLLLREIEGLDALPTTITIMTKTKVYPNLSADRLYAEIGKEAVYVFLKEISYEDVQGNAVKKGAVKIKNTNASSFIVGESLEFFLDETLIVQNGYISKGINWIVYKQRKGKKDEETIFEDEGTSFSYNFDTEGTYKIEAYGREHGANNKKSKKSFAFAEVKIVAQEIVITPLAFIKGGLVRPSKKELLFQTSLKYPKVKTLNPLKLYYQVETKLVNKEIKISKEQEVDSSGIIKLIMPELGTYKIKVISKDQYALAGQTEIVAIKNEVTSIGQAKGAPNKNVFLLGGLSAPLFLEVKNFKIPATNAEKMDVKWIVYDSNNKPYLPSGDVWFTEDGIPKRTHLQKWESFTMVIPDKEGHYTVEAFSDTAKGANAKATFKMQVQRPQVAEAYWAYSNGDKKKISGFSGEVNHVRASIPGYENQKVRVKFYLNDSKEPYYYSDTKTNENGEINKVIVFDDAFQKRFKVQEGKTAKISFKLMGIQNDKLYPFKKNTNVSTAAVLNVATGAKITDAYFQYDGKRVTAEDQISLSYSGEYVTIIAKTQNMIGKEMVLTAHKVGEEPIFRGNAKVDSEGNASGTFKITRLKGTKIGEKMSYYVGIEGYSTKHLGYKGLNVVVRELKKTIDNNLGLIWGAKVSVEFRKKVVQICKELWGEESKLEMANQLMICMNVETEGKFTADVGYPEATGLIQFTESAIAEMNRIHKKTKYTGPDYKDKQLTKNDLKDMTEIRQLDFVKLYFQMHLERYKRIINNAEDMYMAIFAPIGVGKQGDYILYDKSISPKYYRKNRSADGEYWDENKYVIVKGNKNEQITKNEMTPRIKQSVHIGKRYAIDTNEARKLNQVLAEKIIKGGRVTFANSHVSGVIDKAMAQDNINDTALGKNAKRSKYKRAPDGEIEIKSELLYIMYQLSKDYTFTVSEISGADHSRNSRHYFGKAFDISEINGLDIGQGIGEQAVANPKVSDQLIIDFRLKALSYGALLVWNKLNDKVKKEHHNHFHVEIN